MPVLFVPGNHEYDLHDFDAARDRLRATCDRLGLQWLDRETVVLQGVRFVGTTLWSDFDALALGKSDGGVDMARLLRHREKAFRAANFYLRKTGGTRDGEPFLAETMREEALRCQDWLRGALQAPFDGPTVAVTHFAPSLRSADPPLWAGARHGGLLQRAGRPAPLARVWMHGHLHAPQRLHRAGHTPGRQRLGLPRGRESAGLCRQGRAGDLPAAFHRDRMMAPRGPAPARTRTAAQR